MSNKLLLIKVETLKGICELRSEHKDFDDEGYIKIRAELLDVQYLKPKLPAFLEICKNLDVFWNYVKSPKFTTYKQRRQFLNEEFEPAIKYLEMQTEVPSDDVTSSALAEVSWDSVIETWEKSLDRRNTDPTGAITSAKTLLEDICKHILDERDIQYSKSEDLPNLYYKASQEINLHPSQHNEDTVKKLLGVCNSGVLAVGEFRNKYADSHGKGKFRVYPDSDYVKFIVNIAGLLASLMIEKWIESNR